MLVGSAVATGAASGGSWAAQPDSNKTVIDMVAKMKWFISFGVMFIA